MKSLLKAEVTVLNNLKEDLQQLFKGLDFVNTLVQKVLPPNIEHYFDFGKITMQLISKW